MPTLLTSNGRLICVCALFFPLLAAPAAKAQNTQTTIKTVPIKPTSIASGEKMFIEYCAACHGKSAKGDGPAAPALKGPLPDLTTLAQRNGGKYPGMRVQSVLRFGADAHGAHGTQDMPVWGPLFGSLSGTSNSSEVQLRIVNLTHYLETLQVK